MKILPAIIASIIVSAMAWYALVFVVPMGTFETEPLFGATITTINGSDTLSSSRAVINTNFSNLNAGLATLEAVGAVAFSFTPGTGYGANLNSTSTVMKFTVGLQASSTSYFASLFSDHATSTGTFTLPVGASVITPIAGNIAIDTSGQLRFSHVTGTDNVLQSYYTTAFAYGSSTQGMGTTTRYLAPAPAAITFSSIQCDFTNYMRILLYDGTNRANDLIASSTIGTITFSINNTFTAGEAIRVDIGTTTNLGTPVNGGD